MKKILSYIFLLFGFSYIKLNYLANPNNLIFLFAASHSPTLPLHSFLFIIELWY